jgi:N,N-dimethylformamidase
VRITAVFDAKAGTLRLLQEPFPVGPGARAVAHRVDDRVGLRPIAHGLSPRPLVFAAWRDGDDARGPRHAAHYDGKLEAPRLAREPLDDRALEAIATAPPEQSVLARLVGAWDLGREPASRRIVDLSPNALHGVLENLPLRAVTGRRWDALVHDFREASDRHAAIHFHADDLYDAGWPRTFELTVPRDWRSGLYAVRLRVGGETVDHVPFLVTPPRGESRARLAWLAPTATYLAYANLLPPHTYAAVLAGRGGVLDAELLASEQDFGGGGYHSHSDGSGIHHSSHLRPLLSLRPQHDPWGLNADSLLLRWLDACGIDYDVITDHQLHEEGAALLSRYDAVLTGTHPEYHTTPMLDALESWLADGGRLFYAGANGFYWRIALSNEWPAALEMRRAEDGTRTWDSAPGEYHHAWTGELGGLWRRIGRAPNRLVGIGFCAQGFLDGRPYRLLPAARDPRAAWIFEGVDGSEIGAFGPLGGAACEEIDRADDRLGTPPHALRLASATGFGPDMLKTKEEFLYMTPHDPKDPDVRADMVFFETSRGGAVFSTGSIAWAGSLAHAGYRNEISRISENVLRRFLDPKPFPNPSAGQAAARSSADGEST